MLLSHVFYKFIKTVNFFQRIRALNDRFRCLHFVAWRNHLKTSRVLPEWAQKRLDQESATRNNYKILPALTILIISLRGLFASSREVYFLNDTRLRYLVPLIENGIVVMISGETKVPRRISKSSIEIPSYCFSVPTCLALFRGKAWALFVSVNLVLYFLRGARFVFITYSDQVRVADFFLLLSDLVPRRSDSIVVQHGYFVKYRGRLALPLDGARCRNQILLHETQLSLYTGKRTVVGGLPYEARAQLGAVSRVVFVGIGVSGKSFDGSDPFAESLDFFRSVALRLSSLKSLCLIYRPHPSERQYWENGRCLPNVTLSDENKTSLLGAIRSVFVGFESTMLFEAGLAGHAIIRISRERTIFNTIFKSHASFCQDEIEDVIAGITSLAASGFDRLYDEPLCLRLRLAIQREFIKEAMIRLREPDQQSVHMNKMPASSLMSSDQFESSHCSKVP